MRGGPVFEVLFNFDNYLRDKGLRDRFELSFFSPSDAPGKRLGESGLSQLQQLFQERNIITMTGKKIKEFSSEGVVFEDDSRIEADLTVFTPGMTGSPILQQSDLPLTAAGFVTVSDTTQVAGFDNCYAIGDSAYFAGPAWRARQGHLAEVMARTAAENIVRQERGEAAAATFREEMNLLCIVGTG